MCHPEKSRVPSSTAVTLLSLFALSGCATTTHSTVQKSEGQSSAQLRLARPDSAPLAATWRQDGHSIVGSVALTRSCSLETTKTVERSDVTTTAPSKGSSVALIVVGSVLATAGTALLVASKDQDDAISCGSGGRVREGDRCGSRAGAFVELGLTGLIMGASAAGVGVWSLVQKPTVTETPLPPEQLRTTTPDSPCGSLAALDGMSVLAQLPDGSLWRGQVAADGSARIDLGSSAKLPSVPIAIVVDSVPSPLEGIVDRGAPLGEVTLSAVARNK